jgi:dTDP-4-amino-4,6-dideoxygalactose transaminase
VLTSRDDVRQRIVAFCERGNDAFPLSVLQAAVLPAQLAKLAGRNAVRQRAVDRLRVACRGLPAFSLVADGANDRRSAYYKVGWRYDPSSCGGADRETIIAALTAEDAPFGDGFRGFVRRGAARCRRVGELTNSRLAAETTLLLHHPILLAGDAEIDRLAAAMWKVAESHGGSQIGEKKNKPIDHG